MDEMGRAQVALKCVEVALVSGSQRDKDDWKTRADEAYEFVMGKAAGATRQAPTGSGTKQTSG